VFVHRHLLIVFGGLLGLEVSVGADPDLEVTDARKVFHHYLNTCPGQGSRTIRTEVPHLIHFFGLFVLNRQTFVTVSWFRGRTSAGQPKGRWPSRFKSHWDPLAAHLSRGF